MNWLTPKLSKQRIAFTVLAALLIGAIVSERMQGQRNPAGNVAQVGPGSPLPVYVVNEPEPRLPSGFVPGSSWKFTTWTLPSTLTFTATVQSTEGGWAQLSLTTEGQTRSGWYYIPYMPGTWEQQ
jgi:hypothetical protein